MSFSYSSKDIEMEGFAAPELVPYGKYILKIDSATDMISKSGHSMVGVDWSIDKGEHKGKKVSSHFVVFPQADESGKKPKWAGISIHFLKCIGEPWEGDFIVDSMNWWGKKVEATLIQEKGNDGIVRNKAKYINPISKENQSTEEDLPF